MRVSSFHHDPLTTQLLVLRGIPGSLGAADTTDTPLKPLTRSMWSEGSSRKELFLPVNASGGFL